MKNRTLQEGDSSPNRLRGIKGGQLTRSSEVKEFRSSEEVRSEVRSSEAKSEVRK
jgi:hypothetical protein